MLTLRYSPASDSPGRAGRLVNTWRDDAGQTIARAFTNGVLSWIEWPQLGVFEFDAASTVVRVTPAPGAPKDVIETTFVRSLQPIVLQALGWQALHASAVATPTGVIALCGRVASGKSTLAAALARAGCVQLADEALVFRCHEDRVRVHPLPYARDLRPSAKEYFLSGEPPLPAVPSPAQAIGAAYELKAAFILAAADPQARPAIRHLSAVEAFSVLLGHAHCFDDDDRRHTQGLVESYLALAAQVPTYRLTYPLTFASLPEVIGLVLGTERRREILPSRLPPA